MSPDRDAPPRRPSRRAQDRERYAHLSLFDQFPHSEAKRVLRAKLSEARKERAALYSSVARSHALARSYRSAIEKTLTQGGDPNDFPVRCQWTPNAETPNDLEFHAGILEANIRDLEAWIRLLECVESDLPLTRLTEPSQDIRPHIGARLGYSCGPPPPVPARARRPTRSIDYLSGTLDQGPHITPSEYAAETADERD